MRGLTERQGIPRQGPGSTTLDLTSLTTMLRPSYLPTHLWIWWERLESWDISAYGQVPKSQPSVSILPEARAPL